MGYPIFSRCTCVAYDDMTVFRGCPNTVMIVISSWDQAGSSESVIMRASGVRLKS